MYRLGRYNVPYSHVNNCSFHTKFLCEQIFYNGYSTAEPPKIKLHPQSVKEYLPCKPVSFNVQATGTEPLSYQWQWKPAGKGGSSEEWQNVTCGGSVQGENSSRLTYPSIEFCSERLYRCVVTNVFGEETSKIVDCIVVGEYIVVIVFNISYNVYIMNHE